MSIAHVHWLSACIGFALKQGATDFVLTYAPDLGVKNVKRLRLYSQLNQGASAQHRNRVLASIAGEYLKCVEGDSPSQGQRKNSY